MKRAAAISSVEKPTETDVAMNSTASLVTTHNDNKWILVRHDWHPNKEEQWVVGKSSTLELGDQVADTRTHQA